MLITVAFSNKPDSLGNGGLERGSPLFPSIEAISAVSSPQTKAPAPNLILTLKSKPLSKIFSPSNPIPSADLIAFFNLLIANGYSARQ